MSEQRITFRGHRFNVRTRDMLLEAERLAGRKPPYGYFITQGSYTTTNPASGGTHDGGGVFDLRMRDLPAKERQRAVLVLRRVGFAAWLRTPAQADWPYHVHAVAIGDDDLSPAAKRQVIAYRVGRNGLANNQPDDGPSGYRLMTWEIYKQLLAAWEGGLKDMELTDNVPGLEDPDGSPVSVGEALVRGNWAYRAVTEGGAVDKRIDTLEKG